jgi:hypothetical protein
MTVKIQVEGRSFGDLQESIAIIAQAFNVRVFPSVDESMRKADMQTVVETFKSLMAEQGIDVVLDAVVDAQGDEEKVINIDKKIRRSRSAPTPVLTPDVEERDWEGVKAETIKAIMKHYFDGAEDQINKILKKHGGGAKNFNDVPAENYGPIEEAVAALGAQ